ncbi:DNA-primase RepB domain-containing protein [Methylomagnum ishizawai]|nr:DNA-primase RepB domain-containing protein [Methylomagnum ishizawai]
MSCDAYEIGIRDYVEKKMMIRAWSPSKVIESVPWLKRMNLMCNDIFIKPAPGSETGIILIDDIDYDTVEQMKMDGYEPIVVVETSPKNYQGFDSGKSVQEGVRTEAAILLAEEYGGDRNSAHALHFGRLAGFTNRKSEHTTARGQPWALLAYATDLKPNFVASSAEKLLGEAVMAHEDKERASNERMVQARASIPLPSGGMDRLLSGTKRFRQMRGVLRKRIGSYPLSL